MHRFTYGTAHRRGAVQVIGLSLVALVAAACGSTSSGTTSSAPASGGTSSAPAAAPDNVVVGIALSPPKMVFLAPYVAEAKGYFAKENINVKFLPMPNGLETELGTTSGAIDFGFSSATDAIESAAAGSPIHAIWSYAPKLDTQCIAAGNVNTAKDLVGQNVGSTGTGGFSYTQVYACLKPAGVEVKQIKLINMTRSQFVPSLVSNRIKAAVFHADDAYTVLHSGVSLKVLDNEYESMPQWWYGGVTVLDSYAKSNPDLVKRFLTALVEADRWMTDPTNKDEVIQIGVKYTQEDQAAVAYAYDFIVKGHLWTLNDGMDPAAVQYTSQQLLNFKEIDKIPSYDQVVDNSYINSVLDTLGRVPE